MSRPNIRQEILNAIEALNTKLTSLMCAMQQFYIVSDGSGSYQNDALTGNTVRNVFVDGLLVSPAEWSFDDTTGTILFTSAPANGIQILIQYN